MSKLKMIEYLQSRQRDMTDQVIAATGLARDQVMSMMFEMGAQYIERMTGTESLAKAFLKEPLYWAWWKQQWHLMDEQFLAMTAHNSPQERQIIYRKVHENIDVYPDAVIWERIHSTYQKMSQKVIEKSKTEQS